MANTEGVATHQEDGARRQRIRRSALYGAVGGAGAVTILGFSFVVQGWELGIPAWITIPLPAVVAVAAGWAGARDGRADGIRQEAVLDSLAPGETLLSEYLVQPAPLHPEMPDVWDPCILQLTNRRLQLWQDRTLVLSRPWSELLLTAHGDDQVIVSGREGPLVEVRLDRPAVPEELVLAASRLKARAPF